MKKIIYLFLCLLLLSCGPKNRPNRFDRTNYVLGSEWDPLVEITERNTPFVSDTAITTISPYVYVKDVDLFLFQNPPGTVLFVAVLKHEQVHAIRQEQYEDGINAWLFKYATDREFRWQEEQLGFAEEIRYLRANGSPINLENYARSMSENYFGMVSYDDALEWLKSL